MLPFIMHSFILYKIKALVSKRAGFKTLTMMFYLASAGILLKFNVVFTMKLQNLTLTWIHPHPLQKGITSSLLHP